MNILTLALACTGQDQDSDLNKDDTGQQTGVLDRTSIVEIGYSIDSCPAAVKMETITAYVYVGDDISDSQRVNNIACFTSASPSLFVTDSNFKIQDFNEDGDVQIFENGFPNILYMGSGPGEKLAMEVSSSYLFVNDETPLIEDVVCYSGTESEVAAATIDDAGAAFPMYLTLENCQEDAE